MTHTAGVLSRVIRRLRAMRDEAGNVAMLFGLTLPIVVAGAGFGVETSYWYLKDLELQAAADAASYAAAIEKRAGSSNDEVLAVATDIATQNGYDTATGTLTLHTPPESGAYAGEQGVEVILSRPIERYFTSIFSKDPVWVGGRAVAIFEAAGNACILALNPSASQAILFSGNTDVQVQGCDVMANSIADDAIKTQGSSVSHVGCFISGGNVDLTGGTSTMDCPEPFVHAPPVGDPFADVPEPTPVGSCLNDNGAILNAGYYCHGMTLKNNVTLNSGVYYVEGGDFKVNANANITGNGVMIYLAGDARVSINGTATLNLSPPTSGDYSGILFMGDRTNFGTTASVFNGTADSLLTGYLYFATQPVSYLGDFSGLEGCTRVVADTVAWSGSSVLDDTADCTVYGLDDIPSTQLVSLAE